MLRRAGRDAGGCSRSGERDGGGRVTRGYQRSRIHLWGIAGGFLRRFSALPPLVVLYGGGPEFVWRFRAFVWAGSAAIIGSTCVESRVPTHLSLLVHRAFLGLLIRQILVSLLVGVLDYGQ